MLAVRGVRRTRTPIGRITDPEQIAHEQRGVTLTTIEWRRVPDSGAHLRSGPNLQYPVGLPDRFDDMRELFRAELRRIHDVLNTRGLGQRGRAAAVARHRRRCRLASRSCAARVAEHARQIAASRVDIDAARARSEAPSGPKRTTPANGGDSGAA